MTIPNIGSLDPGTYDFEAFQNQMIRWRRTSMKWTRIVHSDYFDLFLEHLFFMENLWVHPADNFFPRSLDVFLCFGIHKSWNQPACSIIILEKGKIFGVEQTLKSHHWTTCRTAIASIFQFASIGRSTPVILFGASLHSHRCEFGERSRMQRDMSWSENADTPLKFNIVWKATIPKGE